MVGVVGVVVGRFQVDQLTEGHQSLLGYVEAHHSRMLVLVGVRHAELSEANPLNFIQRYQMVRESYPNAVILPIVDVYSDELWSNSVDTLIQTVYGYGVDARFHVGRDSLKGHYFGHHVIEEHFFGSQVSATERRGAIKNMTLTTPEQRAGAIHATANQPHSVTMMVDMMMVRPDQNGGQEILLGRRATEHFWRLPGGRIDGDESFQNAAAREMAEETGISTSGGSRDWTYVGDFSVDDWRCRDNEAVTYRTVLMLAAYTHGMAIAGDDLWEVRWFNTQNLGSKVVVREHLPLVDAGIAYIEDHLPAALTV